MLKDRLMMLLEIVLMVLIVAVPVVLPALGYSNPWFWVGFGFFALCVALYVRITLNKDRLLRGSERSTFLKRQYRVIERELRKDGKVPPLRFSVWMPRRNFSLNWGARRWLRNCLCVVHCDNYEENLAKSWRLLIGTGLVGKAFQTGDILGARLLTCSLTELVGNGFSPIEARTIKAENIVEAVAVPIRDMSRAGRVLGVLKIESSASLRRTLFMNKQIRSTLGEVAETIAPFLR